MIVLLDPEGWLPGGAEGLAEGLDHLVCTDTEAACEALSGGAGVLVACHPDGEEAVALAARCGARATLILCSPEHPPAAASGIAGCIVLGAEGLACRRAAVSLLLRLLDEAGAAGGSSGSLAIENARLRAQHAAGIELLHRVSHDLKGPLAVIRGYLSLVLEERYGKTKEELFEALGIVNRRAAQLEQLVGQLLHLARIERGTGVLQTETVDVAAVIEEARLTVVDELKERSVSLSVSVPFPSPVVVADREKLRFILKNLISNATRHGRRGGAVDLRILVETPRLRIEVADDGPGVDLAHGGAAFQRYFDDPDATGVEIGAGLGLRVIRQFVELHGGSVRVASSPGRGSTFTVLLPLEGPAGQP